MFNNIMVSLLRYEGKFVIACFTWFPMEYKNMQGFSWTLNKACFVFTCTWSMYIKKVGCGM